jgi:hypothetical protein
VIVSGDPESSLIVLVLTGEQAHFAELTPDELGFLLQWIEEGAPE